MSWSSRRFTSVSNQEVLRLLAEGKPNKLIGADLTITEVTVKSQRLAAVKKKYDPTGLLFVHHGVGSEEWSADGFTRVRGH